MRLNRIVGVALLALGCGGDAGDDAGTAADSAVAAVDSAAGDTVFRSDTARAELPTHRIYFTLTSYEWYAQGRPLQYEGRAHQPSGMPVPASADEMTRAGEFEGVEYYTRNGEAPGAVYVPVYEGYWQVFRSATP